MITCSLHKTNKSEVSFNKLRQAGFKKLASPSGKNIKVVTSPSELLVSFREEMTRAVFYELVLTPKPGLVSVSDSGAHDDMDIFTFVDSASVILPYFDYLFVEGYKYRGEISKLLGRYRRTGIETERRMLERTGGVNTHRGLIFLAGLVSLASGLMFKRHGKVKARSLGKIIKEIALPLKEELKNLPVVSSTHGAKVYMMTGAGGARAEAINGLPTALRVVLPCLKKLERKENRVERLLRYALVLAIAATEDTNVIYRAGTDIALEFRKMALEVIRDWDVNGIESTQKYDELVGYAKNRGISPGGAADILAVALLVRGLEKIRFVERKKEIVR